jgi:hypothetical protein
MKRRFFAVFAVLLALMLATCDLLEPDARNSTPKFTPDGRPLVRLSIGLGNRGVSRTMNQTQAQGIIEIANGDGYYEVAFQDPKSTEIYRKGWRFDDAEGEIEVPPGKYTNANQAILFAGTRVEIGNTGVYDYTLLAIGIISKVDNVPLGSLTSLGPVGAVDGVAEIFPSTTSVEFTLYALESSVNKTNSSFEILGPTTYLVNSKSDNFSTSNKGIDDVVGGGFKFSIPESGYVNSVDDVVTTPATDGLTMDITKNIVGCYTVSVSNNSLYDGVYVEGNNWVHAVNYDDPNKPAVPLVPRFPKQGETIPSDGGFYFNINVASLSDNGHHKVYMEVPVYAIGDSNSPETWYILGGLDNENLDEGTSNSTGGAFLLNVGSLVKIVVKKDGP